jgi:hypothetical protein
LNVVLVFKQDSKYKSTTAKGDKIAVPMNSTVEINAYLPSIVRTDNELAQEFYANLAGEIKLEHNCVTLINQIKLP